MMADRTYWQHAAGDSNRVFSETCVKYDVVLNGHGKYGHFIENDEYKNTNISSRKRTDLKRFACDIKDGDIIVLRLGTSTIAAVGVIVGEYEWLGQFGDVDGWDLENARRVKWLWSDIEEPYHFPVYTMKLGDTTQQLTSQEVIQWIESLNLDFDNLPPVADIPAYQNHEITFEDIEESLFSYGVSDTSIKNLSNEFDSLVRIAKWYTENQNPSEYETVAYLSVPLLRTLGWTPQRMAIEWRYTDIALFESLPRSDDTLAIVVEAKKKDNSCLTAVSQAEGYAKDKDNCKRLIVTDGLRYGIYTKNTETKEFELYAYVNLLRLQAHYPIFSCHGACEAFKAMTPEWNEEKSYINYKMAYLPTK